VDDLSKVLFRLINSALKANNLLNLSVKCLHNLEDQDEYVINSGINPQHIFKSRKEDLFKGFV
jgi:hypothetical protein